RIWRTRSLLAVFKGAHGDHARQLRWVKVIPHAAFEALRHQQVTLIVNESQTLTFICDDWGAVFADAFEFDIVHLRQQVDDALKSLAQGICCALYRSGELL